MNKQIVREAAEWFIEVNTGEVDLASRKRFDAWLRASPEHIRAFLEIVPIWEDGTQLSTEANATPEELIAWARAPNNIVGMQGTGLPQASSDDYRAGQLLGRRTHRPRWVASLAVLGLAISLGAAGLWGYRAVRYPSYETRIGEQHSIALADGTTIELNSLSRIRVDYTDQKRSVVLLQGQALFHVAKDSARPFTVHSDGVEVRAVGTQFDVYKKSRGTVVTVLEGRVAVLAAREHLDTSSDTVSIPAANNSSLKGPPGRLRPVEPTVQTPDVQLVSAGEQLAVTNGSVHKIEHADIAGATAWTQRQVVFDDTPLPEVVEEFNRYNTRRLSVDAGQLAAFRISGIFSSADPTALLRFLREQPGLRVVESNDAIHISQD